MSEEWKEIEAQWISGSTFIGKNKAGGTVQVGKLDDKPGIGPMELVLVGLAGCTGIDVVGILEKKHEPLSALKVKVRGKRAEDYPQVYKEIEVMYLIWGDGINPKSVERAIQLSEDKYCSVSAMLCKVSKISSSYKILQADEPAN